MLGVFRQYHGDSLYLAAFAASVAFLYWKGKKQRGKTGKKIAVSVLLAVVFVFNEAAYQLVGALTDTTTYYRFFWMLPVLFLVAYPFTEVFVGGRNIQRLLAAAVFALCLGFGANFFFLNRENVRIPKNIYGLDPNAIAVADAIMADWESMQAQNPENGQAQNQEDGQAQNPENGQAQNQEDGQAQNPENGKRQKLEDAQGQNLEDVQEPGKEGLPTVALDMYLEYQVRTYEPRILWGISRKAYLYQAGHGYDGKKYVRQQHIIAAVNEGIQKDSRALRRSLDKNGVDYLVIRTEFDMDGYLSQISVLPVARSESYTLYKVGS